MLAVGVDPGTAITGYGVVRLDPDSSLHLVDFGVIRTSPNMPMPARLVNLRDQLVHVVKEYRPDSAAVEELYFQKNVKTAMAVGQARGVALLALGDCRVPVHEYNPPQIKQAVAGFGGADKAQVQKMVMQLLGMSEVPKPDDAADALAVAICHVHSSQFHQRVEGSQ